MNHHPEITTCPRVKVNEYILFVLVTYRVDVDTNVKVSHFETARQLHQCDYIKFSEARIAVRWAAPEIFTENKFKLQSDVVSSTCSSLCLANLIQFNVLPKHLHSLYLRFIKHSDETITITKIMMLIIIQLI